MPSLEESIRLVVANVRSDQFPDITAGGAIRLVREELTVSEVRFSLSWCQPLETAYVDVLEAAEDEVGRALANLGGQA